MMDLFVALDVEATGVDRRVDRIIEISLVVFTAAGPTGESYTSKVNPRRAIPAEVTLLTGIRDIDVVDAPYFEDIVDQLEAFIGDTPIVAYNAPYDKGMIEQEYDRARLPLPVFEFHCAMEAAKRQRPGATTLNSVCARLGIDTSHRDKHGAKADAALAGLVWNALHRTPELGLAPAAAVADAAVTALEIEPFGDGPPTLLAIQTDMTPFGSTITGTQAAHLAVARGYEIYALADRATTAAHSDFAKSAAPATSAIAGVALPLALYGGDILAFPTQAAGAGAINRLATLAAKGPVTLASIETAIAEDRDRVAIVATTAALAIATSDGPAGIIEFARELEPIARLTALALARGGESRPRRHAAEVAIVAAARQAGMPVVAVALARAADRHGAHAARLMERIGGIDPDVDGHLPVPTLGALEQLFSDVPAALANSRWFGRQLAAAHRDARPRLPTWHEVDGSPGAPFRELVAEGLEARRSAGQLSERFDRTVYEQRLEAELKLIEQQKFDGYYLIVADMVRAAREMGIPVGPGRGSGAGSLAAYALGITNIDPLPYGLLFERFINPERVSLPDFDVDFCEERRGEVIAYLRQRWGADNVAGVAAYSRLKARQALKDAARLAGLPYGQAERLAQALPDDGTIPSASHAEGELRELAGNPDVAAVLEDANAILGLARNRSRHAAGVVISDRPVIESVATFLDDAGDPVTCLDKDGVEAAGLVKFDVLGVAALTVIERTRALLAANGVNLDPWAVPLDDAATLGIFDRGEGIGVFQMESSGISAAARRMGIERFEDIIALVALYRPGPMAHIDTLADRKRGIEPARAPHPALEQLLAETYGVMIYQEQVIEAARLLAGFSLGEADLLRRAMGKKIPSEMRAQEERFIQGFVANGRGDEGEAREMFALIDRFAGYGFNKSHAAAYALISYVTAWLKAHHPAPFLAATLDSKLGDTTDVATIAGEARRLGVRMLPPDMTQPTADFDVEPSGGALAVRWPLTAVRGVGRKAARQLALGQPAANLAAIANHAARQGVTLPAATVAHLAAAGAFDRLFESRSVAIASAPIQWRDLTSTAAALAAGQGALFGETIQEAPPGASENDQIDVFTAERVAIGVNLAEHPADALGRKLQRAGAVSLAEAGAAGRDDDAPRWAVALVEAVTKPRGGRGLYVTLSDASGRAEIAIASSAAGAEHLTKNAVVAIWTTTGNDGRVRATRLEDPAALAERFGEAICIRTARGFDIQTLRRELRGAPPGPQGVEVIGEDGRVIHRSPPRTFALDQARMAAIAGLPGVSSVSTVR